jgi:Domain of unknown function (DUF4878)
LNKKQEKIKMKNIKTMAILIMFVATVALSAACSIETSSAANSPTSVTKRFVKAAQTRNVAEYKATLSKKTLETMDKDAKELGSTTDQMLALVLKEDTFGKASGGEIETRSEKISGDKATVQFKDGNGKWLENDLVKEDGGWKVAIE